MQDKTPDSLGLANENSEETPEKSWQGFKNSWFTPTFPGFIPKFP